MIRKYIKEYINIFDDYDDEIISPEQTCNFLSDKFPSDTCKAKLNYNLLITNSPQVFNYI